MTTAQVETSATAATAPTGTAATPATAATAAPGAPAGLSPAARRLLEMRLRGKTAAAPAGIPRLEPRPAHAPCRPPSSACTSSTSSTPAASST